MPTGALDRERVVPESDDDDDRGLGEHLHVQPGGGAVAESGHADAIESVAAKVGDDLPGALGTAIHASTVAHFWGRVLEKCSVGALDMQAILIT